MKLNHLPSSSQPRSSEAPERAQPLAEERIRRVEAMSSIEGDRQRSLQQELGAVDPRLLEPFAGSAQVLQGAKAVAAQLTLLGSNAQGLVKLRALATVIPHIDDKA